MASGRLKRKVASVSEETLERRTLLSASGLQEPALEIEGARSSS